MGFDPHFFSSGFLGHAKANLSWRDAAFAALSIKNILITRNPDLTDRAEHAARHYFAFETRRDQSLKIGHMERVAKMAAALNDPELIQIAWLHDIVEERKLSIQDIRDLGFSDRVVDAVVALTKNDEIKEPYLNYIERLAQNVDAITVKLFDICDNTSEGVKPERIQFLYPVAKAYLVDAKRRHNRDQPLIDMPTFMCQSPRVHRICEHNSDTFTERATTHYAGTIPCYGMS